MGLPAELEVASQDVKRIKKPLNRMTADELKAVAADLETAMGSLNSQLLEAQEFDPFWFYKPTEGKLSPEAKAVLAQHLHPEDIPANLDGQLHVHQSNANVKLVSGGNQSGKTTCCAIEALIDATGQIPDFLRGKISEERLKRIASKKFRRIRVVCEDYTHGILNHNLPVYRKWTPREYLIDGRWEKSYSDKRDTLTLVNPKTREICAEIEFMTNQAAVETFQGPPVDKIVYDEEPRKDIYEENLLRQVTTGVDVIFGMTPTRGLSWVYEDIFEAEDNDAQKVACFQIPSLANPKADLKALSEILSKIKNYDHLKMRLLGAWISLSGLIYGGVFSKRVHVVDPRKLIADGGYLTCRCGMADPRTDWHNDGCPYPEWCFFRGLDIHIAKETASCFVGLNKSGQLVVDRCYWKKNTSKQLKENMNEIGRGYRIIWSRCDPSINFDNTLLDGRNIFREITTGPDRIANVRLAEKYKGSVLTGVDQIIQLLDINPLTGLPYLIIADRPDQGTQLLINAFRTLQRDAGANEEKTGVRDKILEGKHDLHAAMRYIFQGKLRWRDFEPLGADPMSMIPDEEAALV